MVDKPKAGETQEEYLKYCIPAEIKEGKESDQAVAICYSNWRETTKMSSQETFISQMNEYRERMTFWLAEGEDPCQEGYVQYGMKDGVDGRPVPNCIPEGGEE